MTPLLVTAHLHTAYTASDPWSPALDGILAYWQVRQQLGEEEFALGTSGHRPLITPELPLRREEDGDGNWWWCASSPQGQVVREFARHTHRRFDDQHERFLPAKTGKVLTAGGAYKIYRNRDTMRVVPAVRWHCIGDADAIRALLAGVTNIGRGSTHGNGLVTHWTVEEGGDAEKARFGRPLPVAFAEAHGITGPRMVWGIRPPGRAPEHRTLCVIPI